jgi:predicted secreted hydrolase
MAAGLSGLLGGLAGAAVARPPARAPTAPPAPAPAAPEGIRRGRVLQFPRDHGAHPVQRLEWWYATGWLQTPARELWGFQVTFFRVATGLALPATGGRLAPRQLLLAHAAVTDVARGQHQHADRMARWSGESPAGAAVRASVQDADVALQGWTFRREGPLSQSVYRTRCEASTLVLDLALHCTQPLLLQGDDGFSRKGPEERQASHYTSETQVRARGVLQLGERRVDGEGRAWIDHEWSDELLHPEAVGWDWIGMNLDDGSALTAFQLRRRDGSVVWTGGSWRGASGPARAFGPQELRFEPLEHWLSAASGARYPVRWRVHTPAGRWVVDALTPSQELDSRRSTGTTYWEGLAALRRDDGTSVGRGYLEMTGYAGRLSL